MDDLAGWPTEDWADALDALSAAWRAGQVPGWLFNGTQARHASAIARHGMRSTEGAGSALGDGKVCATDVVHLGTPEIAAWYMHDTATGSGQAPALVAIDLAGWARARATSPLRPLVDENSIEFPVLSAIGAKTTADVQERLGPTPGWCQALAVTGAVVLDEPRVPPEHLHVVQTPKQLLAFLRQAVANPADGPIVAALTQVARAQPWRQQGWQFSARKLGEDPIPTTELTDAEYSGKYGLQRGP